MTYIIMLILLMFAIVNGQNNDGNNNNNANNNNFDCPHSFGYEPNLQDAGCGSYFDCEYNVATLRQCPAGDQFDFYKAQCLRDQDVFCQQQLQNWRNQPSQQKGDEDSKHNTGVEIDTTLMRLLVPGIGEGAAGMIRGRNDEDDLDLLAFLAQRILTLLPPQPVQPNLLHQGSGLQPNQPLQQPDWIGNDGAFNQPGNQPNQFGNGIGVGVQPNQFGVAQQPNQFQAAGIQPPIQNGQQPNLFQTNQFWNPIVPQPNQVGNRLIPNQIQPNQFGNGIAFQPNQFRNGLTLSQIQPNLFGNGFAAQPNQFVGGIQPQNGNVQPNQFALPQNGQIPNAVAKFPNQLLPQFQNQLGIVQPGGNVFPVQNGVIVPNNNPTQVNPNIDNAGGFLAVNQTQQTNLAPAVGAPFLVNPFGLVQAADSGGVAAEGVRIQGQDQILNVESPRKTLPTITLTQPGGTAGVATPRLNPLPISGLTTQGQNVRRRQNPTQNQSVSWNGATGAFVPSQSQNRFSALVQESLGSNGSVTVQPVPPQTYHGINTTSSTVQIGTSQAR